MRALEAATVLEVGAGLLKPFVEQRPAILDKLTALLEDRRKRNDQPVRPSMIKQLRRAIFGASDWARAKP